MTSLVVDRTSNFILSGSSDASVHVWSLPNIISFTKAPSGQGRQEPNSPIRTFSNHRGAITSIALGHSAGRHNIAVSAAKDNTAVAWDYHTGRVLRTFLLPSTAITVTLDPVDRAFYIGYEDGSLQAVEFYKSQSIQHPLHDSSLQSTPAQPSAEDRWLPPSSDMGAAQSLALSYDGTVLLSGHQNGKVLLWNVARRKYASTVADYTHPVTNLLMLIPNGLPHPSLDLKRVAHTIVKPRYEQALSESSVNPGAVPADYAFNTHILASSSPTTNKTKTDQFFEALTHSYFPESMMEEGLAELTAMSQPGNATSQVPAAPTLEMTDVDTTAQNTQIATLEEELAIIKKKTTISESARQATTNEVTKLRSDLVCLQEHINELHQKQEQAQREKAQRQARKEKREARKREAWFAAEKKGRNGDKTVQKMEVDDGEMTSDTDEQSSNE